MSCSVTVPRAVQLVLDDVGWREGWSLDGSGGPWRAGVDRLMEPCDYDAIAKLGARLHTRPQAACVLCEWDRENVCATCPTSTAAGAAWDNSARGGPWCDEAAGVFRRRAANVELALHGVGHEHWEGGVRTRAEWYGAADNQRWPWEALRQHLTVFGRLLDQHGLGPDAGHRFPPSAVPCAFNYYFDDQDAESTGALLRTAGVRRVSTPFAGGFRQVSALAAPDGGYDHGVVVIDRGGNGVPYNVFDTVPAALTRNWICGIHWPNILMPDPDDNEQSVSHWAGALAAIDEQPEMMLAANSAECFAQWVWHTFVTLAQEGDTVTLDATAVPAPAWDTARDAPLWLKCRLPPGEHIAAVAAGELTAVGYGQRAGYTLLGLTGLGSTRARVRIVRGARPLTPVVLRSGTCNVVGLTDTEEVTSVACEVYGRQTLELLLGRAPGHARSGNPRVRVERVDYDAAQGICRITVAGHDIQGERTTLQV